ncbi:MAG: hypothetical protein ACRDDX_04700 [Cellulosilyticaceae bacterium]
MSNGVTLSPPWYTLRNQLAYTIGKTPGVTVGELVAGASGNYTLRIDVATCINQVEAIGLVVPEIYTFGNIKVIAEVYYNGTLVPMPNQAITTVEQVIQILKNALWCNPLVKGLLNVAGTLPPPQQASVGSVVVVVEPYVIQFFNDDISNVCSNYEEVAAKVFAQVLHLQYGIEPIGISFATYNAECMKNANWISVCCCNC